MVNKVLVDYIKEGQKKGFTADQLKKSLLDQNYNINDITDAILEAMKVKPRFFSSLLFKVILVIILLLIVAVSSYILIGRLDLFSGREIGDVKQSYVNKILSEECSGLSGELYAECSTDAIANIALNRNNEKICEFSKFASICIEKFRKLKGI